MGMTDVEATSDLTVNGRPLGVMNWTDLDTTTITGAVGVRELAQQLTRWVDNARSGGRGSAGSLVDRGRYTPPANPYDEMRSARHAVAYDSVVSGVQEVTEAYAFTGLKWESDDPDEADAFNQLAKKQNLDAVVRRMWWDEFACAQAVMAKVWDWVEFTVRGQTKKGNKRKKTYRFWAPVKLASLDPTMVWPVKKGPIADEVLTWCGTPEQVNDYLRNLRGEVIDPLAMSFFLGKYEPGVDERTQLTAMGIQPDHMLVMNPDWTFRHTLTMPDYMHHPQVRLKSCFELLDLKQQLIASDRAMLIGAANYILLIRKGTDELPAQQTEVDNLRENYNFIAKLPVIISDHRLEIEIIAPKTDFTLDVKKYDLLDARLLARLLGTLTVGTSRDKGDTQANIGIAVGRVMENRRHMLRRTLEEQVARAVVEHPRNAGIFEGEPNLVYTPRNISMGLDPSYVTALMALRTQREISRDTILEFMGLDQATEALRMEIEEEFFDDVFKTQIPFAAQGVNGGGAQPAGGQQPDGKPGQQQAPAKKAQPRGPNGTGEDPSVSGARGGRPRGGGQSRQSPQAQTKPRTGRGNVSTQRSEETSDDD